jgi:IS5 family transposase
MRQQGLADGGFEKYRKKTRKELFLDEMDQIIPWQGLTAAIKPSTPSPGGAERMLRIHFLQHWFSCLPRPLKKRCMIPVRCSSLSVSIWGRSWCRMRRPFASSGI